MVGDVSYLYEKISDEDIEKALSMSVEDVMSHASSVPAVDVRRLYFTDEKAFVGYVLRLATLKLPVFKVVVPSEGNVGSIYYVAEGEDHEGEVIAFFRGTYGYYGSGCRQSAFVEKTFKKYGIPIEKRDGDYLLSLLRII